MLRNQESEKKGQQLDSALFKRLDELIMKIPNDPSLFVDQVSQHTITFQEQFKNLISDTQRKNQRFGQLVTFLARCSRFYPKSLLFLPTAIMDLLNNYGSILHPYNRRKAVGCIFILRAKNIIFPVSTIEFLLRLMTLEDKQLRKTIYKYVLNDIRRMNKHSKNQKINKGIQNFIQSYNKTHGDKTVQKNIQLIIDLYKRNIWTDVRAVNIVAEGCLNQSPKVRLLCAHFLLDTTQKLVQQDDSSQDQGPIDIRAKRGIVKQTKVREKQLEKEKKKAAKRLRKKQVLARKTNYMPIDLIYSPQLFCEKVFTFLSSKSEKFSRRLVLMSLVARTIWRHQLILLPFYGFLTKYMQPHQKQITRVLAAFAESLHQNIPEDEVQGIIKLIVEKFVNDKCSEFVMTIGLNTIREAAKKIPSLLTQELMLYLCTYYDYKNRNVSTAAKALINYVRSFNPQILQKKFRGKPGQYDDFQNNQRSKAPIARIPGANLLPHTGSIPIQMDRILTDQDFKMIKKLKRKQQSDREQGKLQNQQQKLDRQLNKILGQDEMKDEGEQQQQQDEQDDDEDSECSQVDQEEIEGLQELEFQQGDQQQGNSQDEQSGDQEQQNEDEEDEEEVDELDWEGAQEIQNEDQVPIRKQIKRRVNKKEDLSNSSEYSDSEEQDDNNGFINLDRIGFYKKSKAETKAQKRAGINQEPKYKHKPKEKKGGTTNREKQKMKPLLMLRAKKNRIRNKEKQVKIKIKDLKNKLGKMKSKKHAQKVKNKKVKKV